jgi:hypothetical protein
MIMNFLKYNYRLKWTKSNNSRIPLNFFSTIRSISPEKVAPVR